VYLAAKRFYVRLLNTTANGAFQKGKTSATGQKPYEKGFLYGFFMTLRADGLWPTILGKSLEPRVPF
jgi:hypothetical protein